MHLVRMFLKYCKAVYTNFLIIWVYQDLLLVTADQSFLYQCTAWYVCPRSWFTDKLDRKVYCPLLINGFPEHFREYTPFGSPGGRNDPTMTWSSKNWWTRQQDIHITFEFKVNFVCTTLYATFISVSIFSPFWQRVLVFSVIQRGSLGELSIDALIKLFNCIYWNDIELQESLKSLLRRTSMALLFVTATEDDLRCPVGYRGQPFDNLCDQKTAASAVLKRGIVGFRAVLVEQIIPSIWKCIHVMRLKMWIHRWKSLVGINWIAVCSKCLPECSCYNWMFWILLW